MNLTHDKEFQRQILAHPAYRNNGVHSHWRILAIMGWLTVLGLMLAMSARSETLAIGRNGKRASSPVGVGAQISPSGSANAPAEMMPPLWGNDGQDFSPHLKHLAIIPPARVCGSGAQAGAGRNF